MSSKSYIMVESRAGVGVDYYLGVFISISIPSPHYDPVVLVSRGWTFLRLKYEDLRDGQRESIVQEVRVTDVCHLGAPTTSRFWFRCHLHDFRSM